MLCARWKVCAMPGKSTKNNIKKIEKERARAKELWLFMWVPFHYLYYTSLSHSVCVHSAICGSSMRAHSLAFNSFSAFFPCDGFMKNDRNFVLLLLCWGILHVSFFYPFSLSLFLCLRERYLFAIIVNSFLFLCSDFTATRHTKKKLTFFMLAAPSFARCLLSLRILAYMLLFQLSLTLFAA